MGTILKHVFFLMIFNHVIKQFKTTPRSTSATHIPSGTCIY